MIDEEFGPNSMGIIIQCHDDGTMDVVVGHNFDEDMDEDLNRSMLSLLQGLNLFLKHHPDLLAAHGAMFNELKQTWGDEFDEDDLRVNFSPDEALPTKANKDENVIPFKQKPRVH